MHNWKLVNLENLGQIITGKTPSTKEKNNFGNKYLFITPRDMLGQKYIHSTERYLSEIGKDRVKNSIIPKNTISVSCIGSDMGKVAMTTKTSITNQQINSIVVNNLCDADFLYYAIINISDEIKNIAHHGTTMPIINKFQFSKLELRLPPLSEQKAIADTLSCLDDKIELNNQINKKLEEMTQAIFKSWFVDFEPFKDGEFEDSELGMIPKGWRVGTLTEISEEIICGKTPPTKNQENYGDLIPFITIPDIHGKVYIIKTERYLSQLGVNSQANKTLPKNSIIVSCIATPGLVALTSEDSQTNQQINSIICKKNISYYYVFLYMKTISNKIRDLGSGGSTTLNLNKTQFGKIKFLLPKEKIIMDFHNIVEPLFTLMLKEERQIQSLINTRNILLPKLMSGEIRVPFEEVQ